MDLVTVNEINYYYQDGESRRYILKDISASFDKGNFYGNTAQVQIT